MRDEPRPLLWTNRREGLTPPAPAVAPLSIGVDHDGAGELGSPLLSCQDVKDRSPSDEQADRAGVEGIEPSFTGPEPAVLPLNYTPIFTGGSPGNRTPPDRLRAYCSALELTTHVLVGSEGLEPSSQPGKSRVSCRWTTSPLLGSRVFSPGVHGVGGRSRTTTALWLLGYSQLSSPMLSAHVECGKHAPCCGIDPSWSWPVHRSLRFRPQKRRRPPRFPLAAS